jgi:hypothetical protein
MTLPHKGNIATEEPQPQREKNGVEQGAPEEHARFQNYHEVLKYVTHRLNIVHHISLDRLAHYCGIPFVRLTEARKQRLDRKQPELSAGEHLRLVATLFELGAEEEALELHNFGVEQYITVLLRPSPRAKVRQKLDHLIEQLREIQGEV